MVTSVPLRRSKGAEAWKNVAEWKTGSPAVQQQQQQQQQEKG